MGCGLNFRELKQSTNFADLFCIKKAEITCHSDSYKRYSAFLLWCSLSPAQ